MSKKTKTKLNYAIPGEVIDQNSFEQMIKKAEQGPFHSIKQVRAELEKWKAKYSNSYFNGQI